MTLLLLKYSKVTVVFSHSIQWRLKKKNDCRVSLSNQPKLCCAILTFLWTKFGYKSVCSPFATTHYVTTWKTIHMYYLKKSHDSLNMSCD
jgi:hypothetical protein